MIIEQKCYSYEEQEEENLHENDSTTESSFKCEMNYEECNRRGYCNGDC